MARLFLTMALLACVVGPYPADAQPPAPPGARPASPIPPRDTSGARTGTGRISGRVTVADTGQPLRRATVRILSGALGEPRSTTTDAEGRYELTGLPAGTYTVNASRTPYVSLNYGQSRPRQGGMPLQLAAGQQRENIDFALPRGSVITGRVLDEFGEPVADAGVTPMRWVYTTAGRRLTGAGRLAMTNDLGEFRLYGLEPGDYVLSARLHQGVGPAAVAADRTGYTTSFYPGTGDATQAQALRLGAAASLHDITVSLVPTRTAAVSGTVVGADGQPLGSGSVSAMNRSNSGGTSALGGTVRPDGSFTINGLPPGEYVLRSMQFGPMNAATRSAAPMAFVSVQGQDVSGIVVAPLKPAKVSGRLTGDPSVLQALEPGMVRVGTMSAAVEDTIAVPPAQPVAVNEDLTFEFQTGPGRSFLRATVPGHFVKAIWMNGRDVIDEPITLDQGAELRDVQFEITNQFQEVTGSIAGMSAPVSPTTNVVILFPNDSQYWGTAPRRIGVGRPDPNGKWSVRTLPPGEYYAVAVEAVESGRWMDPEFLETVRPLAERVSLPEGGRQVVELKLLRVE